MAFTTAQKTQVDRLPVAYFSAPTDSTMTDAEYKQMAEGKLESRTPDQIRARVNITGVSWSRTPVVNFSSENDYTSAQMTAISQDLRAGESWGDRVAEIVAGGLSLEQRVAALEA
jgi:hypothetical protein